MSIITDQEAEIKKLKKKLRIYELESCPCGELTNWIQSGYSPALERWAINFLCDGAALGLVVVTAVIQNIEEMVETFNSTRLLRKFGKFSINFDNEVDDELMFQPSPLLTALCGGSITFNVGVI